MIDYILRGQRTMRNSSRILIIGPSPERGYFGGVATHIRNLVNLSALQGAIVFDPGSFNTDRPRSPFSITGALFSLRRMVREGRYDVVMLNVSIYTFSILKLALMLLLIPKRGVREIHVFFHGGRVEHLPLVSWSPVRAILLPIMNKATMLHFLSRVQKEGFESMFRGCATGVFSNYAATDALPSKSDQATVRPLRLLFVGRILEQKGMFELLEAIEKLQMDYPGRIVLTIVGNGRDLARARRRAESLPPGVVEFLGYLEGPALETAYLESDILILPSYSEAFPYVVIEAMRAGLPTIATPVGALETVICDGVTGLHVRPRDVSQLVGAITTFLNNPSLLSTMSLNCRNYFREHLSKSAAEKYYSQLVQRSAKGKYETES